MVQSGYRDDSEDETRAVQRSSAQATKPQQGDIGALYDQYGRAVYSLALNVTGDEAVAEDISVEVFSRAWRSAATLKQSEEYISIWLFRLTHNLALVALRGSDRRGKFEDTANRRSAANTAAMDGGVLTLVPQRYRWVLAQAFFFGHSCQEIGKRTGQSPRYVARMLQEAMRALAWQLDARGQSHESAGTR